jgi:uncharacterized protein
VTIIIRHNIKTYNDRLASNEERKVAGSTILRQKKGNPITALDKKGGKRMKRTIIIVLFLVGGFALGWTGPVAAQETIGLASGTSGAEWYTIGVAVGNVLQQNIPGINIKHVPGGGVSNCFNVNSGKAMIGVSTSDTNYSAIKGEGPFKEKLTNIKGLINLYMTYCAIAVWKDSGLRQLKDLKGKSLATGFKGTAYEVIIQKQLNAVGLDYKDLKKVEFVSSNVGGDQLKDGHVDAAGKTANKFNSFLMDLASQRQIYLIETPDAVMKKLMAANAGLYPAVVNKGDYNGIDKDIPVVGYRLNLVVNAQTPEDKVYRMVKVLAENWVKDMHPISKTFAVVQPKELAEPIGVEFHPGALKYFKEKGWVK